MYCKDPVYNFRIYNKINGISVCPIFTYSLPMLQGAQLWIWQPSSAVLFHENWQLIGQNLEQKGPSKRNTIKVSFWINFQYLKSSADGVQGCPRHPIHKKLNMKDSWIIVPANCTDNISQEEIEALKAFIVSIGKHRVYVDTAYDLDPLENVKKLYILSRI